MTAMWNYLDKYGMLVATVASLYSAIMWFIQKRNQKRLKEPVAIWLVSEVDLSKVLYKMPYRPARGSVTRAEVLGLLGMIPSRQERYDWKSLISLEFMAQFEEVAAFRRNRIEIPISEEEFKQLDIQNP
jgi:hypothetical protein